MPAYSIHRQTMNPAQRRLTNNFTLEDFLPEPSFNGSSSLPVSKEPGFSVIGNLSYLSSYALQPIRNGFAYPIEVARGYHHPDQCRDPHEHACLAHHSGCAADCRVDAAFLDDESSAKIRRDVEQAIRRLTGRPARDDLNANFYLFAWICLNQDRFEFDRVCHSHGDGPGRPGWVHFEISMNGEMDRQLQQTGVDMPPQGRPLSLIEALILGT